MNKIQELKMNAQNLELIVQPLISWFAQHARSLPWRDHPLPYYVWVSEIMLQQTRVEAVKPFFARFIDVLPDVKALAECPEDRLLKLWEGLGYYNRVRNMQKAAIVVMEQYDGRIPDQYEELLKLPGIGNYTAGAIASIAHGQAVPAVDGNVLRVISRITGYDADIMKQSVRREYEEALMMIMPQMKPGIFNQALMELGATVCVPNGTPDCIHCPVKDLCYANAQGCQMQLPVKAAKKARRIEKRTVLVIRDSAHAAVRKRPEKGLLAGLYELPNVEGHLSVEEALAQVREYGFEPVRIRPLEEAKHIFSHVEWHMIGYMIVTGDWKTGKDSTSENGAEKDTEQEYDGMIFVEPQQTEAEFPIPAAFAAYVKYLSIRIGQDKYSDTKNS